MSGTLGVAVDARLAPSIASGARTFAVFIDDRQQVAHEVEIMSTGTSDLEVDPDAVTWSIESPSFVFLEVRAPGAPDGIVVRSVARRLPFDLNARGVPAEPFIGANATAPVSEESTVISNEGEYVLSATDFSIPRIGFPVTFARTYRSRDFNVKATLGANWDHSFNRFIQIAGQFDEVGTFITSKAVVNLGGGRRIEFPFQESETESIPGEFVSPPGFFGELTFDETDSAFTLETPDGIKLRFERSTQRPLSYYIWTREQDRFGNEAGATYDDRDFIQTYVDTAGDTTRFEHVSGRLVAVVGPTGRRWRYVQDALGDLQQVRGPDDQQVAAYTYESSLPERDSETGDFADSARRNHNLLEVFSPKGDLLVRNTYTTEEDASKPLFDRLATQSGPCGEIAQTRYSYEVTDEAISATVITDPRGTETRVEFALDSDFLPGFVAREFGLGDPVETVARSELTGSVLTSRTEYDAQGRIEAVVSPRGVRTEYEYRDSPLRTRQGDIVTITVQGAPSLEGPGVPDRVTRLTPGTFETPVSILDPEGVLTLFRPNGFGLAEVVEVNGVVESDIEYELTGLVQSVTNLQGGVTTTIYDENGLPESRTLPSSIDAAETFDYSDRGTLLSTIDARGDEFTFSYNDYDEVVSETSWRGTRTVERDENRFVRQTVTRFADGARLTETRFPDCFGRPTRIRQFGENLERELVFRYDEAGDVKFVIDGENNQREFRYDGFGRVSEELIEDVVVRRFDYDADNNLIEEERVIDAETSVSALFQPDPFNAPSVTTGPDGTQIKTTVDARGRTREEVVFAPDGTRIRARSFDYDGLNRLIEATDSLLPSVSQIMTRFRYPSTQRTEIASQGGTESERASVIEFDDAGRIVREVDPGGTVDVREFTNLDLTKITVTGADGSVVVTTLSPDSHGRPDVIEVGSSPSLRRLNLRYDARDNITREGGFDGWVR
ncbi:MAG: DUF6531 domain-containing protein, partial [Myxococcota bacterium]